MVERTVTVGNDIVPSVLMEQVFVRMRCSDEACDPEELTRRERSLLDLLAKYSGGVTAEYNGGKQSAHAVAYVVHLPGEGLQALCDHPDIARVYQAAIPESSVRGFGDDLRNAAKVWNGYLRSGEQDLLAYRSRFHDAASAAFEAEHRLP